jgi:hypothetical protein
LFRNKKRERKKEEKEREGPLSLSLPSKQFSKQLSTLFAIEAWKKREDCCKGE